MTQFRPMPQVPYASYAEFEDRVQACQNAYLELIDTTLQSIFFSQYFSCSLYSAFDALCESGTMEETELDRQGTVIIGEFLRGEEMQHCTDVAKTFTDIIGSAARIYTSSMTPEYNLSYAKMRRVLMDEFIYHFSNCSCLLHVHTEDLQGYAKCVFKANFAPAHATGLGCVRPPVPKHVWQQHILAMAMAGHTRLGARSRVWLLDIDTLNVILQLCI